MATSITHGKKVQLQITVYYYRICITKGKSETITDMMLSIFVQLEFKYQILEWERIGVPFHQHLYVLEIHPVTKQAYFEMEDEPHVLKKVCVWYVYVCKSVFILP